MVLLAFRDMISRFRHYLRFSKEEIEACTISVLVMAFIVSFDKWGNGNQFDFGVGLINLIYSIIIVGIVLGTQVTVIKIVALYYGYRGEFKMWWYGLIIGLVICFLSGSLTSGLNKTTIISQIISMNGGMKLDPAWSARMHNLYLSLKMMLEMA